MPLAQSIARREKIARVGDSSVVDLRSDSSGNYFYVPVNRRNGNYGFCLEGSYFKVGNATFNTAVAWSVAAATTFVETEGSLTIRNSNSSSGKDIILDYIRIIISAAGGGPSTDIKCVMQIDNTVRYSSGGSALTPINCNSGGSNTTGAVVHFGALTLANAGGSARKLMPGALTLKATAQAANDTYLFKLSEFEQGSATAPGVIGAHGMGCVCLPAGANHSFVLHLFSTGQSSAPTAFVEIGYIER